ncbi:hypothetical protein C0J52_10110 [Blattella germanica]|nr:hypothetical protein C0J52_10110 [Blattella germanica]
MLFCSRGVLAVVVVLIAAGTCYEMLQSREEEKNNDTKSPSTEKKPPPGLVPQLLLCFSAVRNGRKILHCGTPEESLTSVHGLRVFSLAWVILVHTYLQMFAIAENKTLRVLTERNFMFQTVSNATFSCMLWSWYMANDTQFYVVGILLLLISVKFFRVVAAVWGLFLVSSWCTTGYISYRYQYLARIEEPFAQFDALYDKPWTRLGPYLVGMGTGWFLYRTKCNIRIPTVSKY